VAGRVKRVLDLTQVVSSDMVFNPVQPQPQVRLLAIAPRDNWLAESIQMTLHTGTHLDAPAHLWPGQTTMDQIPVADLQGTGVVVDLRYLGRGACIEPAHLEPYADGIQAGSIPLLVTGWGQRRAWTREFLYESPWLTPAAGAWLVERRVRGVGIDHFSVGGTGPENEESHRTLLLGGVWIAEDLLFPAALLERPTWHVFALPLLVQRSSGAPARVIAVEYADD
jgi:arylformamidase